MAGTEMVEDIVQAAVTDGLRVDVGTMFSQCTEVSGCPLPDAREYYLVDGSKAFHYVGIRFPLMAAGNPAGRALLDALLDEWGWWTDCYLQSAVGDCKYVVLCHPDLTTMVQAEQLIADCHGVGLGDRPVEGAT